MEIRTIKKSKKQKLLEFFKNSWFRNTLEKPRYINETAVRIRAGILLFIPIIMMFTLFDSVFTSKWIVDGNTAVDTFNTDWDYNVIYQVEAIKRTYDYSIQTWILLYGLFELLAGMTLMTSRLSPLIYLSTILSRKQIQVWKPLAPKRFAWGLGAIFISICLIFFNPEVFASYVNTVFGEGTLPTTEQYIPPIMAISFGFVCFSFMWLETVLGFCVGCKIHALLVFLGILKEECEDCNSI